jgi:CheY-like chemotaxis protein
VEAADGQEAVDKFIEQKNDINLLVLDVVMPRKSGKEAYREIAALCPGIKTIILSGLTRKSFDLPEKGLLFSMKPIMPRDLARSVRELLDLPAGKGRPNA